MVPSTSVVVGVFGEGIREEVSVDEGRSFMVAHGVAGGLCGEEVGRTVAMGCGIPVMMVEMAMWGVDEVCLSPY